MCMCICIIITSCYSIVYSSISYYRLRTNRVNTTVAPSRSFRSFSLSRQAKKRGWSKGDAPFHSFEMCAFSHFEFYDVKTQLVLLILLILPLLIEGANQGYVLLGELRGWRNTVEVVLFEISNSMTPYPSVIHACTNTLSPVIGMCKPVYYIYIYIYM